MNLEKEKINTYQKVITNKNGSGKNFHFQHFQFLFIYLCFLNNKKKKPFSFENTITTVTTTQEQRCYKMYSSEFSLKSIIRILFHQVENLLLRFVENIDIHRFSEIGDRNFTFKILYMLVRFTLNQQSELL